ncbi:MAG: hypothetical protein JSS60_01825 [Verrucomicrobia bacterium]|nr:hypothetical protein [Verrucomicrobiota bacterium]
MTTIASTTTTQPITTATAATPRVRQPEEYTVAGVVLKFFEEKAKDVAKALGYTAFWVGEATPGLPPQVKTFSSTMGDFKNFVSATEVPKKTVEAFDHLKKTWVALTDSTGTWTKVGHASREAFEKVASLTNSIVDGIDFSQRFISYDQTAMTWLKGLNFAATLGGAGSGAIKQVEKIAQAEQHETIKIGYHWINLARDVSYVVLGVLGLVMVAGLAPIAPWMFVACLTSGLSFTIGSYFYEKLYDPESKGANLDPKAVIANRQAGL